VIAPFKKKTIQLPLNLLHQVLFYNTPRELIIKNENNNALKNIENKTACYFLVDHIDKNKTRVPLKYKQRALI